MLGPGTGLGVAGLIPTTTGYSVVTGEGGHATLAPASDEEAAIIAEIRQRCGHCSAERVLSGSGLTLLHDVLHGERGIGASEVSRRAKDGDPATMRTFNMFFDFLGTVASDLTLTLGAMGGPISQAGSRSPTRSYCYAPDFDNDSLTKAAIGITSMQYPPG